MTMQLTPIDALRALVDRLDEIAANPDFKSVWTLGLVHGGQYRGPNWVDALERAKKALKGSGGMSKVIQIATDTHDFYVLRDDGSVWVTRNNTDWRKMKLPEEQPGEGGQDVVIEHTGVSGNPAGQATGQDS